MEFLAISFTKEKEIFIFEIEAILYLLLGKEGNVEL